MLDVWALPPYLDRTMLRQLLTFLALLSGLATTAVPAQAHVAGVETRLEATFEIVVTADKRQHQAALAPARSMAHAPVGHEWARPLAAPAVPAVLVGIDRARE